MPGDAERQERLKAEEAKKKALEAEWEKKHPLWFTSLQRGDIPAVYAMVHTPGFKIDEMYKVETETTPLGWAVIANKGPMTAMLIEAGADAEAEIKFWGKQVWKIREYAVRYKCGDALTALSTAKKLNILVGEDVD